MKKPLLSLLAVSSLAIIFLLLACPRKSNHDSSVPSGSPAASSGSPVSAEQTQPVAQTVNANSENSISDPVVPVPAAAVKPISSENQLVMADFDTGDKPNNLGGDFGAWNKDPEDPTQGCTISFETDDALGDSDGYSLKLDYDVESDNPAYNGFWMKLSEVNAASYNSISFYVRGEGLNNFTKRIKVEMKNSSSQASPYIISGITDAWQKVQIPFERFRKIQDWSSMSEFVVVFDDMNSDPKQGTILIDQIAFEKK